MVSIRQMNYCKSYEEMKEEKRPVKILCDDIYKGFHYIILDLNGSHPTAYIEIPENHKYYGKTDEDVWRIGYNEVTYGRDYLLDILSNTWVIGWDYAHFGDYTPFDPYGTKHSTFQILEEIFEAIDELIEVDN